MVSGGERQFFFCVHNPVDRHFRISWEGDYRCALPLYPILRSVGPLTGFPGVEVHWRNVSTSGVSLLVIRQPFVKVGPDFIANGSGMDESWVKLARGERKPFPP